MGAKLSSYVPEFVSFFYLHAKPVIILREPSLPAPSECLGWTRGHAPRSTPPLLHHCTTQLVLLFRIAIVVDESSANARRPVDRKIEATFAKMLDGATAQSLMAGKSDVERDQGINDADLQDGQKGDDGMKRKRSKKKTEKVTKGDHRIIVECTEVQEVVFQRGKDPEKVFGRRKNRRARFVVEKPEDWKSVDMVDKPESQIAASPLSDSESDCDSESSSSVSDPEPTAQGRSDIPDMVPFGYGSGKIRPPQSQNSINGSIGGEKGRAERIEETNEMKEKRREGQRIAEEREMVRKAAGRGCAFGFVADGGTEEKGKKSERRMCEAVMKGAVVEPSYAKGDWGIRWREKE